MKYSLRRMKPALTFLLAALIACVGLSNKAEAISSSNLEDPLHMESAITRSSSDVNGLLSVAPSDPLNFSFEDNVFTVKAINSSFFPTDLNIIGLIGDVKKLIYIPWLPQLPPTWLPQLPPTWLPQLPPKGKPLWVPPLPSPGGPTAVPEPTSLLLLGFGLTALGLMARRKAKA